MSASPVSTEVPTAEAAEAVTVEATAEEVPAATATEADVSKRIQYSHNRKTDSQNRESVFLVFLFVKPSLKGIALLQPLLEQPDELGIAEQSPGGGVDEAGRDFSGETLDVQVRAEALEQVRDEV